MDIEDVRKNTKILFNDVPHGVVEVEFMKPGKGQAVYRLKLKNLLNNVITNRTFRSGDSVKEVLTTTSKEQYLYKEGNQYVFMNTETFEQHSIDEDKLGENKNFLKEGTEVTVLMMGEEPLEVTLPTFVELKVIKSTVTTKTFTITAQMKPAVLETGYTINVPTFIQEGDILKVDTRTGTYVERINTKG